MEIISDCKIGIFIPCYNVEKTIFKVLKSFSKKTWKEVSLILLIDNCSTDASIKKIKKFIQSHPSKKNKIKIIKNKINLGLGGSQKKAYDFWLKHNFTHSMVLHSDLQCNPEKLVRDFFLSFKNNPNVDIIFASRFHKLSNLSGYSNLRIFVNKFFNFTTFIMTNVYNTDSGCGIIFYKNKILKLIDYKKLTNGPQFNPQLNILACRNNGIFTIDIPLTWKDSEVGSSINAIRYCFVLLKMLLIFRLNLFFGKTSFF